MPMESNFLERRVMRYDKNLNFVNYFNAIFEYLILYKEHKRMEFESCTPDISTTLSLSPKTVSTYRQRIYEKLGVHTDVDLTRLAMRHGLIHEDPGSR